MLKKKFKNIKLIIYDFDGVMTNNQFILDSKGNESVTLNRGDGLAITFFKKLNINQIILSSEKNKIVNTRAKKLNIECFSGIDNKLNFLLKYIKEIKINPRDCCYVGNDINDFETMSICGYKFCPNDSNKKIKKIAHKVFKSKGGDGVIREMLDLIVT